MKGDLPGDSVDAALLNGSNTASPLPVIPTALGEYTVLHKVADGGMATVFLGRKEGAAGFERLVAIKCCHAHLRSNAAFREMFLEEARLAARIHHPNVVATFDVRDGDPLYLVMEFVDGESLARLVRFASKKGFTLPIEIVLHVMADVLLGLHAAHETKDADGSPLGLVHCDVSPQNVLIGLDGVARIVDFGIARAATHVSPDEGSLIKGKHAYMAPEQLLCRPITPRTDIFGAGVMLWEALTGHRLFHRTDVSATIHAALFDPVPAPSSINGAVPPALDEIVLRAVDRDPSRRFATAAEFLAALESLPVAAATPRRASEYFRALIGDDIMTARRSSIVLRRRSVDLNPVTVVVEPATELIAASRGPNVRVRPPSIPPERQRTRRLVVALTLVLLGCGMGVLLAVSRELTARPPSSSAPR